MKKNKAHNASSYIFQEGEPILIDANVWLFLHPPAGDAGSIWTKDYSAVYKSLIKAKARPMTDAMVLSEYLNRYFRVEWEAGWKEQYKDFKSFRKSQYFKGLAEDAIAEARQIVKLAELQDIPLRSFDFDAILSGTENGTLDFNDAVIVETCRHHGWKLLTNDEDCSIGGIEVLTVLPALIRACK